MHMLHYPVHPVNPQQRILQICAQRMRTKGEICVYPTDTVYGIGACATNTTAIDKISTLLHRDKKQLFSYICADFSQASQIARIENRDFTIMKRLLPGPYTFILNATNYVPKKIAPKRRTVGIRMPGSAVVSELVRFIGEPIANTSVHIPGEQRGSAEAVREAVEHEVDIMIDCGDLTNPEGSTIIDLTADEPLVVRQGKGAWEQ
jgi:tRNA threonylcarbamoyl adenosine modification protein (Sua5/YciO/YrdC/YwlC family)